MLLNNDIKASAFQPCVTLSTQETGKAIYLGGRKGRRENVFSGLSSQLGFGSSGQTTKPAPRASVPRSGPCAAYTFRPCKHISRSAQHCPWGRKLPECISTTAGRHAGVTQPRAPGTSHGRAMLGSPSRGHLAPPMGPRRRVAGAALACEKPKQRAQLALAEGSKQPREAFAGSCWAAPP